MAKGKHSYIINQIRTDVGEAFTVGESLEDNDQLIISKINFHGKLKPYPGHKNFEGSCYVVFFENDNDLHRVIIPQAEVARVTILKEELPEENPETIGVVAAPPEAKKEKKTKTKNAGAE